MAERSPGSRLAIDIALYTLARLGLAVVLTLVIFWLARLIGYEDFPLAIAILFALIIALPLGMAVFAPLRRRVTASIAVVDERRRADRADLQARLRGEKPPRSHRTRQA
ncbi:hypothetical protein AOY11_20055 [Mycobacteroides abscessus]|nr:DUF4229 domain-containing protein [Mycobacteroides abscessus]ALM18229.1 hypothetical protein AOY11_20055 [Mycobacteroides abscessus]